MKDEIKEILKKIKSVSDFDDYVDFVGTEFKPLSDYITTLQEENTIKDTNWESLKYYLEKLYYKDYIEEPIFDDIDKKIKELESKVEIKGYQKEIKQLQEENKILKENAEHNDKVVDKAKWNEMIYKSRNEKAIKLLKEAGCYEEESKQFCDDVWEELPDILSALEGSDKE